MTDKSCVNHVQPETNQAKNKGHVLDAHTHTHTHNIYKSDHLGFCTLQTL